MTKNQILKILLIGTRVETKGRIGTIVSATNIVAGEPPVYQYKILLDEKAEKPAERDMFDWSPDIYVYGLFHNIRQLK